MRATGTAGTVITMSGAMKLCKFCMVKLLDSDYSIRLAYGIQWYYCSDQCIDDHWTNEVELANPFMFGMCCPVELPVCV